MRVLRFLLTALAIVVFSAAALAQVAPLPPPPGPAPRGGGHGFPIGVFVALPFIATGIGAGLNALSHNEDSSEPPPLLPPSPTPPNPPQPTRGPVIARHIPTFHVVNSPPKGETRFLPNEILVVFRAGTKEARISALAKRQKLELVEARDLNLIGVRVQRFRFAQGRNVSDVLNAVGRQPQVAMVEPHYVFSLQDDTSGAKPQPAMLSYSEGLLHLSQAHKLATGRGVRVAVIDSQIDFTHPEIDGSVVAHFDALGTTDAKPELHGTAMASAIVGRHQVDGSAPAAQLLAARVFTDDGGPAVSLDVLAGIDWAATQKAQVINMSFAGPADPLLTRMLAAAAQRKIALIAAAGNDGPHPPPEYPAADPNVVAVSAIDSKDQVFERASRGPYVALAAPGVDVLVAASNGGYDLSTGTSVACAEVSGIAALLLERRPDLDGPALRKILRESAHALSGETGIGAGAADAEAAVTLVK
ncbi:MAG: S8 family serine peptidase [Methylovirgula sp.]|jgi:subtilisin family serine protease